MSSSLSRIAIAQQGEDLISFERVAIVTQTSVKYHSKLVKLLGIIEPEGSMLRLKVLCE